MTSQRGRTQALTALVGVVWCLGLAWSPSAYAAGSQGLQGTSDAVDSATDAADGAADTAGDTAGGAIDTVSGTVDQAADTVDETVDGALGDAPGDGVGGIVDDTTDTVDDVTDTVDGVVGGVEDTVDETVDGVGDTVDETTDVVDDVTGGDTDTVDEVVGGVVGGVDETVDGAAGGATGGPTAEPEASTGGGRGISSGTRSDSVTDSGMALPGAAADDTRVEPATHWSVHLDPGGASSAGATAAAKSDSGTSLLRVPLDAFASSLSLVGPGLVQVVEDPTSQASDPVSFSQILQKAAELTKVVAFPIALALVVAGFLALQNKLDRHDPKLALAPVDQDQEVLYFE